MQKLLQISSTIREQKFMHHYSGISWEERMRERQKWREPEQIEGQHYNPEDK